MGSTVGFTFIMLSYDMCHRVPLIIHFMTFNATFTYAIVFLSLVLSCNTSKKKSCLLMIPQPMT